MGTRTMAQVAPTPGTMAMDAFIYGFGGHSLVTPHVQLKQLWWTDERIKAKVTKEFIVSKLRGEERDFLKKPLSFGEGLTDDTYLEWILEKAKRLFLVLTEVGVPDQIFGCVDDSWDDDDLPIPLEDVPSLELSYEDDTKLNRNFYDTQFLYLLRELGHGSHIDYGPKEHIPMEYVNSLPPAVSLQIWDRIHFPGRPEEIYMRRKYSLTDKDTGRNLRSTFMRDVRKAKALGHEHVGSVWASYTSEDAGYIVSDFVGEHTLGTFIDHRNPMQFQRVRASERPILLCEWMHCLSDALAALHHRGAAHTAIRPSSIFIDHSNRIAFADVGNLRTFQRGKKINKTEVYDYAAPESHLAHAPLTLASGPPMSSMGAFNKLRKTSTSTSGSSSTSSNGSSTRHNSICTAPTSPMTPPHTMRSNSMTTITTSISPAQKSHGGFRNFSRHLMSSSPRNPPDTSPSSATAIRILPPPSVHDQLPTFDPDLQFLQEPPPEQSDIYSLGCVFLDILTFMIKGKTNDFVKYRAVKIASPIANSRRARNDTSFHSNLARVDDWIEILKDDSRRLPGPIFKGVPALLELIQSMTALNISLRPSATQVQDRIQAILNKDCGIEALCCADREWDVHASSDTDTAISRSFFRDSISTASGLVSSLSRSGSECPRSPDECNDNFMELSRKDSNTRSGAGRRGSTESDVTAKVSSWRRVFSRS